MTEDFLSPAALEDEAHHRAKLEAARLGRGGRASGTTSAHHQAQGRADGVCAA